MFYKTELLQLFQQLISSTSPALLKGRFMAQLTFSVLVLQRLDRFICISLVQ